MIVVFLFQFCMKTTITPAQFLTIKTALLLAVSLLQISMNIPIFHVKYKAYTLTF